MTKIKLAVFAIHLLVLCSCDPQTYNRIITAVPNNTGAEISNTEVIQGLKEALSVGTRHSSAIAGLQDGFYKNSRLFISFPPEALEMKNKLVQFGFSKKVEEFELSLNRAAEEAATKAAPVFLNSISNMTLQDGFSILRGSDTAATNYLRIHASAGLREQFLPVVKEAIGKVKLTSYWNPLVTAYNSIPGVTKQNPNLDAYVTDKAIDGLIVLISDEEISIRKDPAARVTELLKKVFGGTYK